MLLKLLGHFQDDQGKIVTRFVLQHLYFLEMKNIFGNFFSNDYSVEGHQPCSYLQLKLFGLVKNSQSGFSTLEYV